MNTVDDFINNPKYLLISEKQRSIGDQRFKVMTFERRYDGGWRFVNGLGALAAIVFSLGLALLSNQIRWMWNASIKGKGEQQEVIQKIFDEKHCQTAKPSGHENGAIEEITSDPASNVEIQSGTYNAAIDVSAYAQSFIMDEDMAWNLRQAPYLLEDIRMGNGDPIPLEAGDYLLKIKFLSNKE